MSLAQGLPLILSEAHDIIRNQHACLNEQSHQINEQSHQINEQSTLIGDQEKEINYLKEQLRLAKMKLFGRSSERFVDPDDPQYQLFDEMPAEDAEQNDGQDDDTTEVSKHKRNNMSFCISPWNRFPIHPNKTIPVIKRYDTHILSPYIFWYQFSCTLKTQKKILLLSDS